MNRHASGFVEAVKQGIEVLAAFSGAQPHFSANHPLLLGDGEERR